ncbi:hypothetical protein ACFL6S_36855 [Candidatus Poribacteria bacterium]
MAIRWARVFFVLFILALIINIAFLVSNHDDARDFVEDFLESDNGTAFVVFSLLIIFVLLFMKFIAYVVGLFRRG